MASKEASGDDTVKEIARRWMEMETIKPVQPEDELLPRRCQLQHIAFKFTESVNEIWIDGVLGVIFTADQPSPAGEMQTKVDYDIEIDEEPQTKTTFYAVEVSELARWHLAWLTDPNVWIDSATIDMEFDQKLLVEKRHFKVRDVNISVQTNYPSVHGWLQHMEKDMKQLIFRGNGIMDANKFLQLPFAARLRKLMILYESSFDDRLIVQLNAQHLQISSDFLTEIGINKLLHLWNTKNYPMQSEFLIYARIKDASKVVKDLDVVQEIHPENGVSEYLIEMVSDHTRMRVITRPSSVVCTIFAVDNSQAPPPLSIRQINQDMN